MVSKGQTLNRTPSPKSNWVSLKPILFFLLVMAAGFVLTSESANASGFQDALFGSGVFLWVAGVFGEVYCVVRRLAGPKAAKLAVLVLFLILLGELFLGKRENPQRQFSERD